MITGRVVESGEQICTIEIDKEELPEALWVVGAAVSLDLSPAGGMVGPAEARNLLNYLLQIA